MGVSVATSSSTAADACRLLIGGVLLLASVNKLLDISSFTNILRAMPFLGSRVARILSFALPIGELAIGAWLAVGGSGTNVAAAAAAGLFILFAAIIAILLQRKQPIRCGCFGHLSKKPASWATVARNGVFIGTALVAARWYDVSAPSLISGIPALLSLFAVVAIWLLITEILRSVQTAVPRKAQ